MYNIAITELRGRKKKKKAEKIAEKIRIKRAKVEKHNSVLYFYYYYYFQIS